MNWKQCCNNKVRSTANGTSFFFFENKKIQNSKRNLAKQQKKHRKNSDWQLPDSEIRIKLVSRNLNFCLKIKIYTERCEWTKYKKKQQKKRKKTIARVYWSTGYIICELNWKKTQKTKKMKKRKTKQQNGFLTRIIGKIVAIPNVIRYPFCNILFHTMRMSRNALTALHLVIRCGRIVLRVFAMHDANSQLRL